MTDRELLEKAAKAAGIVVDDWTGDTPRVVEMFRGYFPNYYEWNPLTDDGDALRLAVKLHLALLFPMLGDTFPQVGAGQVGSPTAAKMENAHPDPYAATRRAIVRAAASLAKEG